MKAKSKVKSRAQIKAIEKSKAARIERLKQHQWSKGKSGNPDGRPKKIPGLEAMLVDLLGDTTHDGKNSDLRKVLINLIKQAKDSTNVQAIRYISVLLEKVYGKDPIIINSKSDITSGGAPLATGLDLGKLDDDTVKKLMDAFLNKDK